jgi:Mn2+/Fe2+ NRAMP family transporter
MSLASPSRPAIDEVVQPPQTVLGILRRLGPGLIIAGSIVGSGELIATTKTGAEAGFWLLWLIIVGCVIKVFVQVELGRDAVVRGKTTMEALAEVPGPAIPRRGNWLVWYYFLMFAASIGQLGGIVGGVGQALAISLPLTQQGRTYNQYVELETKLAVARAEQRLAREKARQAATPDGDAGADFVRQRDREVARLEQDLAARGPRPRPGPDDRLWAALVSVITAGLLLVGHYSLIQNVTTAMVALFTFVTVANVVALQWTTTWAISPQDVADGLSFRLPPQHAAGSQTALATALKTFGIIGVGATELVAYPYWCLEKGYARFTGPRDDSPQWAARARGWMNVMRYDAWCSMVVYTIATVAFYLLGAAILGRTGLNPTGNELIRTLGVMYEPVFGRWAEVLFLLGAFAVLYSTFFVANAGHARVVTDGLGVMGLVANDPAVQRWWKRGLSGGLPLVCLAVYVLVPSTPDQLVLLSGMMQALMLPMLSAAAIYFRYYRCDPRIRPGRLWDACLWISSVGMLVAGTYLAYGEVRSFAAKLRRPTPAAAAAQFPPDRFSSA